MLRCREPVKVKIGNKIEFDLIAKEINHKTGGSSFKIFNKKGEFEISKIAIALYLLVTRDSMNMDLNDFLNFLSKISSTKARHTISFDTEVNEDDKEIFRGMFNIAKDQWKQINEKELPNIHVLI
uniref:Uncharacterized protein n=1 Tax=Panagrolaimus davidi TaxID=227884 RepID=A0A914PST9_9BILA